MYHRDLATHELGETSTPGLVHAVCLQATGTIGTHPDFAQTALSLALLQEGG